MFSPNKFNNNNKKVTDLSRYWIVDSYSLQDLKYVVLVFLVHGRPDIMSKMIINHQQHNIVCCKWVVWLITAIQAWSGKLWSLLTKWTGDSLFSCSFIQFVLLAVIDIVYYYFGYDIISNYMKSIINVTWN